MVQCSSGPLIMGIQRGGLFKSSSRIGQSAARVGSLHTQLLRTIFFFPWRCLFLSYSRACCCLFCFHFAKNDHMIVPFQFSVQFINSWTNCSQNICTFSQVLALFSMYGTTLLWFKMFKSPSLCTQTARTAPCVAKKQDCSLETSLWWQTDWVREGRVGASTTEGQCAWIFRILSRAPRPLQVSCFWDIFETFVEEIP